MRAYGTGDYKISMRVMTTALNSEERKIGMIIRTTKKNSFSTDHSGNYFYRLAGKYHGLNANEWFTLSGYVTVSESDISSPNGTFNLMLDVLAPVDGQAVYIDEVCIQKQEINTDFTFYYDPINMCIGETKEIYLDPYSSPYTAYFESANTNVAVVSSDGKVTGISEGTTSIYVTRGGVSRTCTVNVSSKHFSILNGEYYIRNAQMKKYLQIDDGDKGNNYSSNKVIMELWNFDDESEHKHQLWNFIYLGDGYYKIISSISGRALSVKEGKENVDNEALIQEDYSGLDRQKWMILRLDNGNFKIKPKSSESHSNDWCAAAGSGIGDFNGRNVEQRNYVADDELIDEWTILSADIHPYSNIVNIDVLYDRGFAERFAGKVNETICTNLRQMREYYLSNFNIMISFNLPHPYISLVDNMPIKPEDVEGDEEYVDYNGQCLCLLDQDVYHDNFDNNMNAINWTDGENCVRVVFSGHSFGYINGVGKYFDIKGKQKINNCVIGDCVTSFNMLKTTIHEFGHLYEIEDHYGLDSIPSTEEMNKTRKETYCKDCIYGEYKEDQESFSQLKMCSGCTKKVNENKSRYKHK